MTDQHPITVPPEFLRRLREEAPRCRDGGAAREEWIATNAARWGSDQELEACCDTLQRHAHWDLAVCELVADRRPKPPSLKEQALLALETADGADHPVVATVLTADQHALIRKALEALDD